MNSNKPYNRMDRVANQILDILCGILTKNIDLSQLGFVTFTHVDISPDLRYAKVFYSVLGRKKTDEEINIEINKRRKAFKKYMSPELQLKCTPELRFYHDESFIYGKKINELLKDARIFGDDHDPEPS